MNILIVCQYFWPEFFLINEFATELKKTGHQITTLTGMPNYPQGKIAQGYSNILGPWNQIFEGVQIKRLPLFPRGKGFLQLALNYISFVISGIIFGVFRLPKNTDIIFCFGLSPVTQCIPAILYKYILRKPLVLWVQDIWPESVTAVKATDSRFIIKLLHYLVGFIYKHCDFIFIQSEAFRPKIERYGYPTNKIKYIPNWYAQSPGIQTPPQWIQDLPKGFKVVFAGNIGKAQSVSTIIEAAEKLKNENIFWLIVGDGSEKHWLDQQVKSRNLSKVILTGRKENKDMPALFQSADACLVTLTKQEIFSLTVPSKVQAYMSESKPILASLDGEGARIVENSNSGFTAPSENSDSLADITLRLFNLSHSERNQMGTNGLDFFIKNFEREVVLSQIVKIFNDLIQKQKEI